ncbi:MAG: hypothetical protein ACK5RG_14920 [Cyclobacteriaceae bacterium]|jgi:hypothetical protein|nr:hypothetical protein [Flammeovirgaceae bacterium]
MRKIEEVKVCLESTFPEYTFSIGKRLLGECIIAKNTKYSGADIFVHDDKIIVEAALPEMKTRILLGSGVLFLKFFSKKFSEPSLKIHYYLAKKYPNVKRRI